MKAKFIGGTPEFLECRIVERWTSGSTPTYSIPSASWATCNRAYAELNAAPLGARIDVVAALTDMVAYNGGRPLSCRA